MKYNLAHKLLFVDTNVSNIYYFSHALWLDNIIKGKSKYGVQFLVKSDIKRPEHLKQSFDYFWGRENANVIYYEHPLFPNVKAKLLLDMSKGIYSITVNRSYYRLARYRFENVWPPGQHLTNLITMKLLQNNILTLHSASFSNKKTKEGYLVLGASNTGKSYTTFAALEKGYEYHSEDLSILDKEFIYTTPLISAHSDKLPNKDLFLKYNLFIYRLIGVNVFLHRFSALSSFRTFFKRYDVNRKAEISKIFILEKGHDSIRKLSYSEASRKILILNRLELRYYGDHLLRSYSYFNSDVDIDSLADIEEKLIEHITKRSQCFVVNSNSPDRYLQLINKVIE